MKSEKIRLSVIVPVYNVEKYLRECIDSILTQDIDEMEVILVDDRSTDRSGGICDEYAEKDNRVTVIHKENGGCSAARNAGLDIAQGEYITFVDSDDYLLPDTYRLNVEYMEKHHEVDCLQFPTVYDERIIFTRKYKRENKARTFVGNEIFLNWWSGKTINHFVWNKIYKREMWENLRFMNGAFVEDCMITPDLSTRCQMLHLSQAGGYFYRYTEGSLLNSAWTEKKNMDFFMSRYMMWQRIDELDYMNPVKIKSYLEAIKWLAICHKKGVLNYIDYDKFLNSLPSISLLPKSRELGVVGWAFYLIVKILGTRGFVKLYRKV